jgi:hypothetical protein
VRTKLTLQRRRHRSPLKAAASEYLGLRQLARAVRVSSKLTVANRSVKMITGAQMGYLAPTIPERSVFVYHSPEFWKTFGIARPWTGGVGMSIETGKSGSELLLRIQTAGKFKFASLISMARSSNWK